MTRIFDRLFLWKMDSMSGTLCLPFRPKTVLQYKTCVQLWNNFPCISTLNIVQQTWKIFKFWPYLSEFYGSNCLFKFMTILNFWCKKVGPYFEILNISKILVYTLFDYLQLRNVFFYEKKRIRLISFEVCMKVVREKWFRKNKMI